MAEPQSNFDPEAVLREMEKRAAEAEAEQRRLEEYYKDRDEATGKLCICCGEEIIRKVRWSHAYRRKQNHPFIITLDQRPPTSREFLVCPGCGLLYDHLGPKLQNKE